SGWFGVNPWFLPDISTPRYGFNWRPQGIIAVQSFTSPILGLKNELPLALRQCQLSEWRSLFVAFHAPTVQVPWRDSPASHRGPRFLPNDKTWRTNHALGSWSHVVSRNWCTVLESPVVGR